jgi:DUF971 family protein
MDSPWMLTVTGRLTACLDRVRDDVAPVELVPLGRYAVSVRWNDGHQSLMPYRSFLD